MCAKVMLNHGRSFCFSFTNESLFSSTFLKISSKTSLIFFPLKDKEMYVFYGCKRFLSKVKIVSKTIDIPPSLNSALIVFCALLSKLEMLCRLVCLVQN